MSSFIKLGARQLYKVYGKYLILQNKYVEGNNDSFDFTFWDTETNREICPPLIEKDERRLKWNRIEIHDECVVLRAYYNLLCEVKSASGYHYEYCCVFIKSKGEFLVNPHMNYDEDIVFDEVKIKEDKILCSLISVISFGNIEKTIHWFDFNGTWQLSTECKLGGFDYETEFPKSIILANGEKIDKICEISEAIDSEAHKVQGLYIICLAEDKTKHNYYYPF